MSPIWTGSNSLIPEGKVAGFVSNIGPSPWQSAKDDALSHGGPIFRAAANGAARLIGSPAQRAST